MSHDDQSAPPGPPKEPSEAPQAARPGDLEIGVKTINVPGYSGPERRKGQRRKGPHDRRQMLRFEPDKAPRRSGQDRRGPKSVWDGRNEA